MFGCKCEWSDQNDAVYAADARLGIGKSFPWNTQALPMDYIERAVAFKLFNTQLRYLFSDAPMTKS